MTCMSCTTCQPIADPLITAEVEIFPSLPNDMQFSCCHYSTYNLTTSMTRTTCQPVADPLIPAKVEMFVSLSNEKHFST